MKILLLYPTITIRGKDPSGTGFIPPLGLAYLAAAAEEKGHEVKVIDCIAEGADNIVRLEDSVRVGLSDEDISKRIKEFTPVMVGISSMYSAYAEDVYRLAEIVKQVSNEIIVVAGGAHVCAMPTKVLQHENIDICVIGEGEVTFTELAEKVEAGVEFLNIDGIAYRGIDGVVFTKERSLIDDLDVLPSPAWHLLPMEIYFKKHSNPYVYHNRHTFMITSRGCPMQCVYCSIHSVWKHTWRARSPEKIVEEIEYLVAMFGVREVHFVDDNLTVNRKRARAIFELLIERKINIKWTCPNGTAIWTLDEGMLRLMKKSGCYRLTFGIESGSSLTQKFIGKNLNLKKAKFNIKQANRLGLWTVSTYILGFPYQDEKQIEESINFAIDSTTDFATFYPLMPFPATKLWGILKEENLIDETAFFKDIGYYLSSRGLDTKYFSHQEIQEKAALGSSKMIRQQIKRLFFNPVHYLRKIQSIGDFFYFLKLFKQFTHISFSFLFNKSKMGGTIYWKKAVTRE